MGVRNPKVFLSTGNGIIQTVLWDFQVATAQFKTTTRWKTDHQQKKHSPRYFSYTSFLQFFPVGTLTTRWREVLPCCSLSDFDFSDTLENLPISYSLYFHCLSDSKWCLILQAVLICPAITRTFSLLAEQTNNLSLKSYFNQLQLKGRSLQIILCHKFYENMKLKRGEKGSWKEGGKPRLGPYPIQSITSTS